MLDWQSILTRAGVNRQQVTAWAPIFAAQIATPARFSLGPDELDDFIGQICHESGMLTRLEESLTYSTPERIMAVWPRRFPTRESALPFVRNGEALANQVYGGRMGNTEPGDGWRYRGRGLIQVTGRDNYTRLARVLGLDLVRFPEQLARPETALRSAIAWWEGNVPDGVMGDIVKVTRAVNGGTVGLDHRRLVTDAADRADGRADGRLG